MTDQRIVFVFPGQGSQSVGMLSDWFDSYPKINEIFDKSSNILGYDLTKLVQSGPRFQLDSTIYTQPAIYCSSYALFQVITKELGIIPKMLAGHSLGEYSALACGGAISFEDGLKLVAKRAQLMEDAIPSGQGAMAVIIGLEQNDIQKICKTMVLEDERVFPANFNSPKQIVISGYKKGVTKAMQMAKDFGAKIAKELPISIPAHCELMQKASVELEQILNACNVKMSSIPIMSNVDAKEYTSVEQIITKLTKQLYSPVLWADIVEKLADKQYNAFIECGPGKVLTGLLIRNPRLDKKVMACSKKDDFIKKCNTWGLI